MNIDEPDPDSNSEPTPDESATGPTGAGIPSGASNAFRLPTLGPFPIDALPNASRNFVEATANAYRIDLALPGMSALVTLGAAPGKNLWVTGAVPDNRETPCNLYAIVAAPMAYGKSAAANIMEPIIAESDRRMAEYHAIIRPRLYGDEEVLIQRKRLLVGCLASGVWSGGRAILAHEQEKLHRDLADIARKLAAIKVQLKSPPTLHMGSCTAPALGVALARNDESLLLFTAEAGESVRIVLGRFSGDGKPAFDLYLSGYTVERWIEGRVSRDSVNIRPCLSLLWLCQPSILREILMSDEALERGLFSRILFCELGHNQIPYDDGIHREIPADICAAWDAKVQIGLQIRDRPDALRLPCAPDARDAFLAWHNESVEYRNGSCHHVEGVMGRWREQAIRISACLALADAAEHGKQPAGISLECAERAIVLARWACFSSLRLIHDGRRDRQRPLADRLTRLLVDAGGSQTLRNLDHHNGLRATEVRTVACAFPERFRVVRNKGPGPGRPSEIVELVR